MSRVFSPQITVGAGPSGSLSHPVAILIDMGHAQLHLIYIDEEMWKLDDRTIRVGRKGLANARAALARSARPFEAEEASLDQAAA